MEMQQSFQFEVKALSGASQDLAGFELNSVTIVMWTANYFLLSMSTNHCSVTSPLPVKTTCSLKKNKTIYSFTTKQRINTIILISPKTE